MKHLLITGSPGIGKTTLIRKLVETLKLKGMELNGFYTEEIRNNKSRVGFDIVTLDGKRGILARRGLTNTSDLPTVGQYVVHINDFEKLAIPIFECPKKFVIIDEIGKMEMTSKKFQQCITNIFQNKNVIIIATVPVAGGSLLVKQLKERKDCQLITVNQSNRDTILSDITSLLNEN